MTKTTRPTILADAAVLGATVAAAAQDKTPESIVGKKGAFQAGDVGTVPKAMPHFVENTGNETLRFLELFQAPRFVDVSLAQWMALTPHERVRAHLNLNRELLHALPSDKRPIV